MNLQQQILLMRANLDSAEEHIKSLEAGRKSSSSKARSALQKIKGQSHDLRKSVISTQKALPTKKRTKVIPVEPSAEPEIIAEVVKKPRKPRVKKEPNAD
jgi:hypothetical protein